MMIKTVTLILYIFTVPLLMLAKQGGSNSITSSFNFPSFGGNTARARIELEHDATLSPHTHTLELTTNLPNADPSWSYGRASYGSPVRLWDPLSGTLVDFETRFAFSMRQLSNETADSSADGMTFFLAPFDSKIANDSSGAQLGLLPRGLGTFSSPDYKFVAVEFDTHQNDFDPSPQHVGIDINTVVSKKSMSWTYSSMSDGREANAWVRYDSTSRNLSVFLTYDQNPVFSWDYYLLSYVVDLRDYLPARVRVGFTGATGLRSQTHSVYSWSFNSTLNLIDERIIILEVPSPSPEVSPSPSPPGPSVETVNTSSQGKGMKYSLATGLALGFGFVIFCL